jgi:hypothetical protein
MRIIMLTDRGQFKVRDRMSLTFFLPRTVSFHNKKIQPTAEICG